MTFYTNHPVFIRRFNPQNLINRVLLIFNIFQVVHFGGQKILNKLDISFKSCVMKRRKPTVIRHQMATVADVGYMNHNIKNILPGFVVQSGHMKRRHTVFVPNSNISLPFVSLKQLHHDLLIRRNHDSVQRGSPKIVFGCAARALIYQNFDAIEVVVQHRQHQRGFAALSFFVAIETGARSFGFVLFHVVDDDF